MYDALNYEPGNAEPNTEYTNDDWLNEFCGEIGNAALSQSRVVRGDSVQLNECVEAATGGAL